MYKKKKNMSGRRSRRKVHDDDKPTIEIVGIAGGSLNKGCVIGGRNIKFRGPIHNTTRVVGVEGGSHSNVNIIGLDGAVIGGDSGDDDDFNLKDPTSYFGGKDTGVLMIAGKTRPKDGAVFLNDLDDLTEKLKGFGIVEDNIFKVTPQGQGKQVRNITRAVEDLTDLDIKKFILIYAGHCNQKQEFWMDNRESQGFWYPHQKLKACLQKLPASKMLIILDTCFSGSLDLRARGEEEVKESGERGGDGKGQKRGTEGNEDEDEIDLERGGKHRKGGNGRGRRGRGKHSEEEREEEMQLDLDDLERGSEDSQQPQRDTLHYRSQQDKQMDNDMDGQGTRAIGEVGGYESEEFDGDAMEGDDFTLDDDEDDFVGWVEPIEMPCFWDIFEGREMMRNDSRGLEDLQAVQWCSSSPDQESHNHGGGRNGVFTNAILETVEAMPLGHITSVINMHKQVFSKIKLRQIPILKPDEACKQSSGFMNRFPKFRKTATYLRQT